MQSPTAARPFPCSRHGTVIRTQDYATKLLAAILTDNHIGILQLGDGAIITTDNRQRLTIHTVQQTREYVNEVTCLTSDTYKKELRITVSPRRKTTGLAVVTDGIESISVKHITNTPNKRFFGPLFAAPPAPARSSRHS